MSAIGARSVRESSAQGDSEFLPRTPCRQKVTRVLYVASACFWRYIQCGDRCLPNLKVLHCRSCCCAITYEIIIESIPTRHRQRSITARKLVIFDPVFALANLIGRGCVVVGDFAPSCDAKIASASCSSATEAVTGRGVAADAAPGTVAAWQHRVQGRGALSLGAEDRHLPLLLHCSQKRPNDSRAFWGLCKSSPDLPVGPSTVAHSCGNGHLRLVPHVLLRCACAGLLRG